MKTLLLYDPLIIGHHLIYATNLINWALSRKFEIYFASADFRDTFLYRNFKDNRYVNFIEIDFIKDFKFSARNTSPTYADLFFTRCPIQQYQYVLSLQDNLRPDLTLFLYGDHMDYAWKEMVEKNIRFSCPTFMIYLFSNSAYFQTRDNLSSNLLKQIQKIRLFDGIYVLDEYQSSASTSNDNILFLPDPYKDHSYDEKNIRSYLTTIENSLLDDLAVFLRTGKSPILMIIGWLSPRKNTHWLLELTEKHKTLSVIIIGKRVASKMDKYIDQTLITLKNEKRLFYYPEFVSPYIFDYVLKCSRINFLVLPYSGHYGSSALQLLAMENGLPTLVPDIGLMGTRNIKHNLGFTFIHENKADFHKQFVKLIKYNKSHFFESIKTYINHFSREKLYESLDMGFKLKERLPKEIEVDTKQLLVQPSVKLSRREYYLYYYHKTLKNNITGHFRESLQWIEKALSETPNHPALLFRKSLILQNYGYHQESFKVLYSLHMQQPEYMELVTYRHALFKYIVYLYSRPTFDSKLRTNFDFDPEDYFSFINFNFGYINIDNREIYLHFLIKLNKSYLQQTKNNIKSFIKTGDFKLALTLVDSILIQYIHDSDLNTLKAEIINHQYKDISNKFSLTRTLKIFKKMITTIQKKL